MKSFILLLSCCITCFTLTAQVAVTIQGNVSYLLGEGVANVQINIYNETDPFFTYANTVYTDESGYYSDVIEDAPIEGIFTIEMIDCDDSSEIAHRGWFGDSTDIVQNFIFCEEPNNFCFAQIWGDSLNVDCDSIISLYAAAEGVPPLSFVWSNGSTESEIWVTESGCYGLTVTDAIGCVREDDKCVEFLDNCCSTTIIQNDLGNVLEAIVSGTAPFTYEWSTGSTEGAIVADETGNYCVTTTDAEGCVSNSCYFIFISNPTDSCSVELINSDSSFCLFAVPTGVAPFTYDWEWETNNNSPYYCAGFYGTHCVTITDANGCIADACYDFPFDWCAVDICEVEESDEIELHALPIGNAPFVFEWNTGETEEIITPTEAGNYCVTMTDATGCESSNCYYYNQGSIDSCIVELIWHESVGCLQVYAEGVAPFIYIWNIEGCGDSNINCPNISGNYCVTVIDATGCEAVACYEVDLDCGVQVYEPAINPGVLEAYPTGAEPFTYDWDTGDTTSEIIPNGEGTYCVTLTDATGCVSTDCFDYWLNPVDTICYTYLNEIEGGTCLEAVPTGIAPFTYLWSDGSTNSILCGADILEVYCVTVTDAEGCVGEACGFIENPNFCTAQIDSLLILWTGETGLFAYADGVAPFHYEWNTGSEENMIIPTEAGEYCVTVTDGFDCVATDCFYFSGQQLVDTCYTTLSLLELGNCLQADTYGNAPFTYEWSDGSTEGFLCSFEISGEFCVTVTDATGCVSEACGYINNPNCSTYIDSTNTSGGQIQLNANTDGTAPFTYEWSTGSTEYAVIPEEAGFYCVTVTDAEDCVSISCYQFWDHECYTNLVEFEGGYCLQAITINGNAPFTYEWSDGSTDPSICATGTGGEICVTVTDATGCVSNACGFLNNPNCFTYIDSTNTSSGNIQLSANTSGVAPFTYEWNTGSTEYAVIPEEAGFYCVTVTDAEDCVSTSCFYYTISCDEFFSLSIQMSEDNCLIAVATGEGPFTYNWIFNGLEGPTICPDINASYCVEVSNGNDCVLTECFHVDYLTEYGYVAGNIFTDSITPPVLSGLVYLIAYDSIAGTLTEVSTAHIMNEGPGFNSYFFQGVPAGNYLVKVALDENSDDYEDYLPTYYGDVLFWDEAHFVGVPYDFFTADIHMVAGENSGGPGFIGGLVIEGANFTGFADTRDEDGDPIANVEIILLDESGNPVAYTYTNEDGEYEFDNLAWGTYQVVVEILGFEQAIFEITIGPNDPVVNNIIFEVDEDSVSSVSTAIEDILVVNQFSIYPNPTNGELTIEMEMKANVEVFISLMSVDGRKVLETFRTVDYGMNRVALDLSKFTNGVYFLNIVNGQDIISRKVIKQN